MAAEPVPRKGHWFKAVHGKITSSLSPVANLAITAQHLPHFRARQHLHSVSSDTPAGCANTATCRSRVPTPSQSADSLTGMGSALVSIQQTTQLLHASDRASQEGRDPPGSTALHCPEEHQASCAPSNPFLSKPREPDVN